MTAKKTADSAKANAKKPASDRQKKTPSSGKNPKASRTPTPDPDSGEFVPADDPAAELLDNAVKQTPWWAMSAAFHGLALAVLPLVVFSHKVFTQETSNGVIIRTPAASIARINDEDLKRTARAQVGDLPTKDSQPQNESDLKPVYDPTAAIGERDESDDNDDHHERKGQSMDGMSADYGNDMGLFGRQQGKGPGNNISIGVGGGSGSGLRYGGAFGGRKNQLRQRNSRPPTRTDSAVDAGLRWLCRHQNDNGSWSAAGFAAKCKGTACHGEGMSDFDTGLTGLSLLAFLGAGYTPGMRAVVLDPVTGDKLNYGRTLERGLKWLIDHQNAEGAIGPQVGEMMYNHAIAALALAEAYGLSNAFAYRGPAQKAINFLQVAQNPYMAWRYTAKCNSNDTSVTGWCIMALKSAQISGLEVSQAAFQNAKVWLDRVTDRNTGVVGYDRLNSGEIYVPGKNEAWAHHPSMTAVGILCRVFIDKSKDKVMQTGASVLMQDLPKWDPKAQRPTVDFYYWYYATLALYQLEGGTGPNWKKWNTTVCDVLCANQKLKKDGCSDGSWDTDNCDRWAYAGGRVYGTAINVLTLEASYRYEAVFGASEKRGK